MRVGGEKVGVRGMALLAVTAAIGIALGIHGWSGRERGLPPALASSPGTSAASHSPASPAAPVTQGPTTGPSHAPAAAPSGSPAKSPAPQPGPKLSSESYATYAFLVWPGAPTSAATAAKTGLLVSVRASGSGIWVSAGVAGQPKPAARYYPGGVKVYVIEASLGDDSGNVDYNLGDDGLVVTDQQGRILQ